MPETNTSPASSGSSPFHWKSLVRSGWIYPLALCLLFWALLSVRLIGDYDLGTHLKAGQWILQNHAFPNKDSFTYTQTNQDYLDSNGLYQIILFLLQDKLGFGALNFLNSALILLVFGLVFWRLRLTDTHPGIACLFLLLAAVTMERRFMVRPEIFSWLFLTLTLLVLDLRTRNKDFLFLLPFIQLLWVNIEGLFILGWFVMAAYALSGWHQQKRWDPKLVKYGFLSLAASLLNPYFLKGALFPLFLLTRLQGENLHKQTITELRSPLEYLRTQNFRYDSNPQIFLFFLLAVLCALVFFLTFKRRKWNEVLLLAAFGYTASTAVRNIPLFALVAFPILAISLKDLIPRQFLDSALGKKTTLGASLLIVCLCARVLTNAYYITDRRVDRFGIGLDPQRLPARAAEFLAQNHLDGRMLNHLNFGGWLDWKGPQPTFIDGRSEVMEDRFYAEYLQSFQGNGLLSLLARYQPQLILMEYNAASPWVEQLRHYSDWRLIFLDESTAIYAHQDYAKQFPALSFPSLLTARNIPTLSGGTLGSLLDQNPPSRTGVWLAGFYKPQAYPMGLFSMGLYAMKLGEYPTARDLFAEGYRQAGGGYEEVFYNLGVANLHLKDYALGRAFLEKVLFFDPQNAPTLQMLNSLNRL